MKIYLQKLDASWKKHYYFLICGKSRYPFKVFCGGHRRKKNNFIEGTGEVIYYNNIRPEPI
jgi:hypothetical protein